MRHACGVASNAYSVPRLLHSAAVHTAAAAMCKLGGALAAASGLVTSCTTNPEPHSLRMAVHLSFHPLQSRLRLLGGPATGAVTFLRPALPQVRLSWWCVCHIPTPHVGGAWHGLNAGKLSACAAHDRCAAHSHAPNHALPASHAAAATAAYQPIPRPLAPGSRVAALTPTLMMTGSRAGGLSSCPPAAGTTT